MDHSLVFAASCAIETKKADVVDHLKMAYHVGLLADGPPGSTGLPLI
jgi:hypothetical protein